MRIFFSHPAIIRKDMKNVSACQTFSICKSLDKPLALLTINLGCRSKVIWAVVARVD